MVFNYLHWGATRLAVWEGNQYGRISWLEEHPFCIVGELLGVWKGVEKATTYDARLYVPFNNYSSSLVTVEGL